MQQSFITGQAGEQAAAVDELPCHGHSCCTRCAQAGAGRQATTVQPETHLSRLAHCCLFLYHSVELIVPDGQEDVPDGVEQPVVAGKSLGHGEGHQSNDDAACSAGRVISCLTCPAEHRTIQQDTQAKRERPLGR